MIDRPRASVKMGPKPADVPQAPPPAPATVPPAPAAPAKPAAGPRKPATNPRQSEYERLMELVEQLREQFPNKSESEILSLAKRILANEKNETDLWDGVKAEYGVTDPVSRRAPRPAPMPTPKPYTPGPRDRGSESGVPSPAPSAMGDVPAYIPSGAAGVMVPNPAFGKKHGLVLENGRWVDGTVQNQQLAAQQAEQEFLAEKRRMELEQLRMEMELERLRKEREMSELRKDPVLAGLTGGSPMQEAVRPLAGRGMMY